MHIELTRGELSDLIEILEGVKSGEVIATSNLEKLQEGGAVSAVK